MEFLIIPGMPILCPHILLVFPIVKSSKYSGYIADTVVMVSQDGSIVVEEQIQSFGDLKSFIYSEICKDHGLLAEGAFTKETVVRRGSEPCGIVFCLYGPRAVQFSAIWEWEGRRALFYNPNGTRYREITLDVGFDVFKQLI